jgi:formiminotetrahydrofolate cyclodeaminase
MERARALANEDAAAYAEVSAAMDLPKETDEQKAKRTAVIQAALTGAAIPPLETMRAASEVAWLSGELVKIGNRSAISDVGTAALQAVAAYGAARLNVVINLMSVRDQGWVAETRNAMNEIPDPAITNTTVQSIVARALGGE